MKKFRIDESEKSRILGMHINATEKQYLTEQDNGKIMTQHKKGADILLTNGPKPTGDGERYCFTKEFLTQEIANTGYIGLNDRPTRFLHQIGDGDTFNEFQNKTDQDLQRLNPLCKNLKDNFRKGDIIQYTAKGPFSD